MIYRHIVLNSRFYEKKCSEISKMASNDATPKEALLTSLYKNEIVLY